MGRRSKSHKPTLTLQITRTHVLATMIRPSHGEGPAVVRCREIEWRKTATTLASEAGAAEFAAAMKLLIAEEKLAGWETGICLNEEFCVTRIVTGPTDKVRKELTQLEERSSLYLTLGGGPKTHARCLRQLDARHQHALLTVANKKVLDAIMATVHDLGLEVTVVEPVLVALSRLLKKRGYDAEHPVIVANLSPESFELGISHQGQLLLDYRPGGRQSNQGVSEIVERHWARLDRYCQRYFKFNGGSLKSIYLCGADVDVQKAREGFSSDARLTIETPLADGLVENWDLSAVDRPATYAALLGTQLLLQRIETESTGPNFMERIRAETREPILPGLIKSAWPVAAALLLCVGLSAVVMQSELAVNALTAEMKELEPASQKISQMRIKQITADGKSKHLATMQKKLTRTAWNEMVATMGRCLPDDVWLEGISVQGDGKMQLTGSAYSEGGIYEFIRYLKQYPVLSEVALEQTTPATLASGPATKFDLNCDLAGYGNGAKQEKKP